MDRERDATRADSAPASRVSALPSLQGLRAGRPHATVRARARGPPQFPHVLVGGRSFHAREEVAAAAQRPLVAIEWPDDDAERVRCPARSADLRCRTMPRCSTSPAPRRFAATRCISLSEDSRWELGRAGASCRRCALKCSASSTCLRNRQTRGRRPFHRPARGHARARGHRDLAHRRTSTGERACASSDLRRGASSSAAARSFRAFVDVHMHRKARIASEAQRGAGRGGGHRGRAHDDGASPPRGWSSPS